MPSWAEGEAISRQIHSRFLPVDIELVAIPSDPDREVEEVDGHITYLHSENNLGEKTVGQIERVADRG